MYSSSLANDIIHVNDITMRRYHYLAVYYPVSLDLASGTRYACYLY